MDETNPLAETRAAFLASLRSYAPLVLRDGYLNAEALAGFLDTYVDDAARWRAAEAEGHIVDFTRTGFGLQHPPSCRPNLIGCRFNVRLSKASRPAMPPGRYRMAWDGRSPKFEELR